MLSYKIDLGNCIKGELFCYQLSGNGKKGLNSTSMHTSAIDRPNRKLRGRKQQEPVDPNQTDAKVWNNL